jgi:predicted Zn finger-like uncharacterized protein
MVSGPLTDARLESIRCRVPFAAMLIVCPHCSTAYAIDAARLGAGRTVRCARCRNTWQAVAEPAATAVALADARPAPAAPAAPSAEAPAAPTEMMPPAADAPPLVPEAPGPTEAADPPPRRAGGYIESAAARRARQGPRVRRRARLRVSLPLVIGVLLAVIGVLAGARVAVVRAAPQTARLYAAIGLPVNLRGLAIEEVRTSEEMQDNVPVLVVEGTIVNVVRHPADVPRLRFAVRNAAGLELYAWTAQPNQPVLAAGEKLAFRSRLASPPPDAADIVVRFFNRRDLEAVR